MGDRHSGAYRTAVTGTNSTMADPMRSRSINPITPSMFRSARLTGTAPRGPVEGAQLRAVPPDCDHGSYGIGKTYLAPRIG